MIFQAGLVPWYLLLQKYFNLGNTYWAMILPYLLNPFYMFLMRNFFFGIPDSLSESAKIDGATNFIIFSRIILPLSKPVLATVGLFTALRYWNDWWLPLMFVDKPDMFTLQYQLRMIISNALFLSSSESLNLSHNIQMPQETIKMATTFVTIGPIILLYPFVQKYFVKGVLVGSIKG